MLTHGRPMVGTALGKVLRRQSLMRDAVLKARANRLADEAAALAAEHMPGSPGAEYWQQGDVSLYTEDNLERRLALRHHALVVEALQLWWSTALRSMQRSGDRHVRRRSPRLARTLAVWAHRPSARLAHAGVHAAAG